MDHADNPLDLAVGNITLHAQFQRCTVFTTTKQAPQSVGLKHHPACLRIEHSRLLRDFHTARLTSKQRRPQVFFKLLDGDRQGWLADEQPLRRTGDVALLEDREKRLEMTNIHRLSRWQTEK
ncbi:hypothetical protein D3C78_1381640 [compost metagenome]